MQPIKAKTPAELFTAENRQLTFRTNAEVNAGFLKIAGDMKAAGFPAEDGAAFFRALPGYVRYLQTLAYKEVNAPLTNEVTAPAEKGQPGESISELEYKLEQAQKEATAWQKRHDDIAFNYLALKQESLPVDDTTYKAFAIFMAATGNAFRTLFADDEFPRITAQDLVLLMLDYCHRDPSNEFPFEPEARAIYNRIKNDPDEWARLKKQTIDPVTHYQEEKVHRSIATNHVLEQKEESAESGTGNSGQ